jgi:membrane dipeptidase
VRVLFMTVGILDLLGSSMMLDGVYNIAKHNPDEVEICYTRDEVYKAVSSDKLAIILSIESQLILHGQLDMLRNWHRLGVRVANLTHGEGTECMGKVTLEQVENMQQYALQTTTSGGGYMDIAAREQLYKKEQGLTDFGKLALEEMAKLDMVCDLSHANDATFWQALELSTGKLCVTHSNCAALCSHARNLTDNMMKALAQHGGVMGLCFFGEFIDQKSSSLARYVEHILHALTIMGPDHVGIGSDYDGVPPNAFMAIPHPGHMNELWEALDKAGVDKNTMRKIAHENFLYLL